ncbi:MAG: DUF2937 family protein [Siculibacillus sp.]|nr:DUF2937 family protein [Siculibacillus sp.]
MYRLFAILLSCVFGFGFSQLPEFGQQYRQRLGGAVDELSAIIDRFDADGRRAGLDRAAALERHRKTGDEFFARRARDMEITIDRLDRLRRQQRALVEASGFARLLPLVTDLDRDLAGRTFADFEPAVPLTQEGLGLGALGLMLGRLVAPLLALAAGRRRLRRPAPAASSPSD